MGYSIVPPMKVLDSLNGLSAIIVKEYDSHFYLVIDSTIVHKHMSGSNPSWASLDRIVHKTQSIISTYHRCSVGGLMGLTVSSKSIFSVAWFVGFTKEPDWYTLDFRAIYISRDSMLKSVFVLELSYLAWYIKNWSFKKMALKSECVLKRI